MAEHPPFTPLVASVIEAQIRQTQGVTNAVIEGLTARAERAEAALGLVRERIDALCRKPWTPNPSAILAALYPAADEIEERRAS